MHASTLLGYGKDELINMSISDFDIVETREESIQHTLRIAKNRKEVFETKQRCKDGTIIVVEVSAQPIKIHDKTVVQSIWRNITERKRIEEALRQSEHRYRALFENIDCGVAVYEVTDDGKDFIVKDFNRAGETIDNESRTQLIGEYPV
jgi:PAS domain S-box-containing protein